MDILLTLLGILTATFLLCLTALTVLATIYVLSYLMNATTESIVDFLFFWKYRKDALIRPEQQNDGDL